MSESEKRAEASYLLEAEDEMEQQQEVATLKAEWMANWLEETKVTGGNIWEAFTEQPILMAMVDACNSGDEMRLGCFAKKMINDHMAELAAIAYDERMT